MEQGVNQLASPFYSIETYEAWEQMCDSRTIACLATSFELYIRSKCRRLCPPPSSDKEVISRLLSRTPKLFDSQFCQQKSPSNLRTSQYLCKYIDPWDRRFWKPKLRDM